MLFLINYLVNLNHGKRQKKNWYISITDSSCTSNVTYESTQSTWLTASTSGTNIRIRCSKNTTVNSRNSSVNIKMNGTTCATVNVTQNGITCPQYQIVPDKEVTCDGGAVHFSIATNA